MADWCWLAAILFSRCRWYGDANADNNVDYHDDNNDSDNDRDDDDDACAWVLSVMRKSAYTTSMTAWIEQMSNKQ